MSRFSQTRKHTRIYYYAYRNYAKIIETEFIIQEYKPERIRVPGTSKLNCTMAAVITNPFVENLIRDPF